MGDVPMVLIKSDPKKGNLYRCRSEGCHLKDRKGVLYCQDVIWDKPPDDPRVFPPIKRGSDEWKRLYRLRQSVERHFKALKQSRRLEDHCVRGLPALTLHAAMSTLMFQATASHRLAVGEFERLRWQVRKVA